jgi:DNA invertase Pin-like site-specific DNA recombinase
MALARAKGKLRGKQPKLSPQATARTRAHGRRREYTIADLAELFTVSRTTVYRTLQRDMATAEQDRR